MPNFSCFRVITPSAIASATMMAAANSSGFEKILPKRFDPDSVSKVQPSPYFPVGSVSKNLRL